MEQKLWSESSAFKSSKSKEHVEALQGIRGRALPVDEDCDVGRSLLHKSWFILLEFGAKVLPPPL